MSKPPKAKSEQPVGLPGLFQTMQERSEPTTTRSVYIVAGKEPAPKLRQVNIVAERLPPTGPVRDLVQMVRANARRELAAIRAKLTKLKSDFEALPDPDLADIIAQMDALVEAIDRLR
jgi:hypothetical protein